MNDILAEWLTEMIQVFFFAVFELLKMFFFLEFKTVLFFSILLYNTKIYIKLDPTRFLNCKKKKKTLKKVYHMFKEFLCS